MSGNEVAMTLTAHLEPVDGGKRTLVTASVERGDAPDDFVSPAFRSEGITMALEDELNEATQAMVTSSGNCRELLEQFEQSNMANMDLHNKRGLADGMGDVAKLSIKMQAYQAQARRMGCDEYFGMDGNSVGAREEPEDWDEPADEMDAGWGN